MIKAYRIVKSCKSKYGRIRGMIAAHTTCSPVRSGVWHVERRRGTHIIKGTAIGFSYTPGDRHLVPGLLRSFSFAEFVVSYYDKTKDANFKYSEAKRHKAIIKKAHKAGAKYFCGVSPKIRISSEAIKEVRRNMHIVREGRTMMSSLRFFWGMGCENIRIDGLWGTRKRAVFFPILPSNRYGSKPLHHKWWPKNLPTEDIDVNQYYIGRNTVSILEKKFNYYKSQEYQTKFWKNTVIEDFISEDIEVRPVYERVRGVGRTEKTYKG